MLISIIYRSLYCCILTGIHRSMERVTSDFRRSCVASSSSVFIVAINTCNTLQTARVHEGERNSRRDVRPETDGREEIGGTWQYGSGVRLPGESF